MSAWQIRFLSGSGPAEPVWLEVGRALSLGRSHSNSLRLTEPDVSGRHVILRLSADGCELTAEILSSRRTMLNGKPLSLGDIVTLSAGDRMRMGGLTEFTVGGGPEASQSPESVGAGDTLKTMVAPAAEPAGTAAPSAPGADATVLPQTPAPAEEEEPFDDGATRLCDAFKPEAFAAVPPQKEKTIISAPKPEKTMVSAPPSDKTVVSVPPSDKTVVSVPMAERPEVSAPQAEKTIISAPRPDKTETSVPSVEKPSAPVAPAEAPAEPTEEPKKPDEEPEDLDATQVLHTRKITTEGVEAIRQRFEKRRRKRVAVWLTVAALFLGGALFSYLRSDSDRGQFVLSRESAPKAGEVNNINFGAMVLRFPKTAVKPAVTQGKGRVEVSVVTSVGNYREIPLYLTGCSELKRNELRMGRNEAFEQCKRTLSKAYGYRFDDSSHRVFKRSFNRKHLRNRVGVPYDIDSYTRTVGKDDRFGYLVYFRFRERTCHACIEIPEKWHSDSSAEAMFDLLPVMVRVSGEIFERYWEGSALVRKGTTADEDIGEAKEFLAQNKPQAWEKARVCLVSALIKLTEDRKTADIRACENLLTDLHRRQTVFYNDLKVVYQRAKSKEDRASMALQRERCKAAFPDKSSTCDAMDYRGDLQYLDSAED